jgi:ferredoxin-type protein NapG
MDPNKPVDRRRFFREGLRGLLRPLADAVEPIHEAAKHLERMEQLGARTPAAARPDPVAQRPASSLHDVARSVALRPPGALPEQSFLDTCSRCGECVRVCPAQCIQIDSTGRLAGGAPYIVPDVMACVVCDGLKCMHVCPSGALVPTALGDIDMGTAVWDSATCVRRDGEDCTTCVDTCPVGTVAIELRGDRIHVIPEGCIGCGVCQHECPTDPKSIVVIPVAAKGATTG